MDIFKKLPVEIIDTSTNPPTRYTRISKLGKGGNAMCFQVTVENSGIPLAMKVISKKLLEKPNKTAQITRELLIHQKLDHPNIVKFHKYFSDQDFVYIILELCNMQTLMELSKRRVKITEPEAKYFLRQICEAVTYLHEKKGVVHRDLKLANVFISDMNIKIGDFGMCYYLQSVRETTICGTPNYLAPEVINRSGYSLEIDVWSIGCILYALLVGSLPFKATNVNELYPKILRGDFEIPDNLYLSNAAITLIRRILTLDPSKRPSIRQILEDDFLINGFIPKTLPSSCITTCPRFNSAGPTDKSKLKILIDSLQEQVQGAINGESATVTVNSDDQVEVPSMAPTVFVLKWLDYSQRFGFAYQMSNASVGTLFNDDSATILFPDDRIKLITKDNQEAIYNLKEYPNAWEKKVNLSNHFKTVMGNHLEYPCEESMLTSSYPPLAPLFTWFRSTQSVIMCFRNGTVQINNFITHRKLILCPLQGAISVLEKDKRMRTFSFTRISKSGCTTLLKQDLQYAYALLRHIPDL